jgi:hypothetical protein
MDWIHPFITRLEAFGDEAERLAHMAAQKRHAGELQKFVFETSRWLTPGNIADNGGMLCHRGRDRERER